MKVTYTKSVAIDYHTTLYLLLPGDHELPFMPAIGMGIGMGMDEFVVDSIYWHPDISILSLNQKTNDWLYKSGQADLWQYLDELRDAGWIPKFGQDWPQHERDQ